MDAKDTAIAQMEHDHGSHPGDSEEKGVTPANAYLTAGEDYHVTFKTWIVVIILASAYGVRCCTTSPGIIHLHDSRYLFGLSLPLPSSIQAWRRN